MPLDSSITDERRVEAEAHIRGSRARRGRAHRPALPRARVRAGRAGRAAGAAGRRHGHGGGPSGADADHRRRPRRGRRRSSRDGLRLGSSRARPRRSSTRRRSATRAPRSPTIPERETAELALILESEGLPRAQAEQVALGLAANANVFLRTKVQKELGLSPDTGGAALGDALVVGGTYLCAAIIPLWPYLLFPLHRRARREPAAAPSPALFALGVVKGRLARMAIMTSGSRSRSSAR